MGEQELFTTELEIDDQAYQFQAVAITVANAAPPTSVLAQGVGEVISDDGLLDITIITLQETMQPTITNKLRTARYLMNLYGSALVGQKAELPGLYHFRAHRLKLTSSSPQAIVVDGEMVGTTPMEVACLPGAFTVIAPPQRRPSPVEKIAVLWAQRVSPSLSALIAALGVGGLLGIPIVFWLFMEIATGLLSAQTEAIETRILWQIHQLSHPLLDKVMLAISPEGSAEVAVPVFLITVSLLCWRRNYWKVLMLIFAYGGALIVNRELKLLFERPRPELWPPLIIEPTYSFPSWHALEGTVVYGTSTYLLAIAFPKFAKWIYGAAVLLVGTIGFSRLYLGVHWPLDVLAG